MKKIFLLICLISVANTKPCNAQNQDFHDCKILELILKDSAIKSYFYIEDRAIKPVNLNDADNFFGCSSINVNGKVHNICSGFSCGPLKIFIDSFSNDSLKLSLADLEDGNWADLLVVKKQKKYILYTLKFGFLEEG